MTKTPMLPPVLKFLFEPVPGVRRRLTVRTPDEGTLAVWGASGERFQSLGEEWAAAEEALAGRPEDDPDLQEYRAVRAQQSQRALVRALKIINTALTEQADRDWLDDCLLEQRFKLGEALGILSGAVEELKRQRAEQDAQAPAAPKDGPPKARRV